MGKEKEYVYDICVLGAGPAGLSAAYTAGKLGKKVILIEQSNSLGGVSTSGLMSHWTGNTKGGLYNKIIKESFDYDRFINKNCILDENLFDLNKNTVDNINVIINPETLKLYYIRLMKDANVDLKLYTFAYDVKVEDSIIESVSVLSKSGIEDIKAKIFIDGTGDGDIAYKAGVPFSKGRENDNKMQPVTIMFKMGGIDMTKVKYCGSFEDTYQVPSGDLQTLAREKLKAPAGHVLIYPTTLPNVVTLNMTNCIGIDGTDSNDLTKAEIKCREQMEEITKFLRDYVTGFEKSYVISSASYIGIRETRHFKGLDKITETDIIDANQKEDWIVRDAYFNFDIHNIDGAGLDKNGVQKHFEQKKGYGISYGCFITEEIENLFLSGRMISGTHKAHSNYRVMPICVNMGQGVGIAAALAIDENKKIKDLDVKKIQQHIIRFEQSLIV